jgi:hypothetical protein
MPTFYTKAEARSAALNVKLQTGQYGKASIDILREDARATSFSARFDIFLSHASSDADLILGVRTILEGQGYKVYVDWIDDAQLDRSRVTPGTAELLRGRMRQSNSMVWVATEAASSSKWMPWELGYFDGQKPKHVAILPLVDNPYETFRGQEYLALYPLIDKNQNSLGETDLYVESYGNEWTTLKSFATGNAYFAKY